MDGDLRIRPVQASDTTELADLPNEVIAAGGTTALEEPFTPDSLTETMLIGPHVSAASSLRMPPAISPASSP